LRSYAVISYFNEYTMDMASHEDDVEDKVLNEGIVYSHLFIVPKALVKSVCTTYKQNIKYGRRILRFYMTW
jgi:hypothetical protein